MRTYVSKDKVFRLLSYVLDVILLLLLCFLLSPLLGFIGPQALLAQINLVHASVDPMILQMETLDLMSLVEDFTIAFASIACMYEIIAYSLFHTTIGKCIVGLKPVEGPDSDRNEVLGIVIRSITKAVMIAFLGSILIVFSGFAVIASPTQVSIQDRIGKTRIVKK